jgi:hypothetical protein
MLVVLIRLVEALGRDDWSLESLLGRDRRKVEWIGSEIMSASV